MSETAPTNNSYRLESRITGSLAKYRAVCTTPKADGTPCKIRTTWSVQRESVDMAIGEHLKAHVVADPAEVVEGAEDAS